MSQNIELSELGQELIVNTSTNAVSVNGALTITALTTSTNTATFGSAMYVAANGNVGIGNSSPTDQLSINGTLKVLSSLNTGISISQNGGTINGFLGPSGFGGFAVGSVSNDHLVLFSNNSTKILIAANGNIGISNTSPAQKISVNGSGFFSGISVDTSATAIAGIDIGYNTNYAFITSGSRNSANVYVSRLDFEGDYFRWLRGFGTAEIMRLDASGNLGIGTVSPPTKLAVVYGSQGTAGADVAHMYLKGTGGGGSGYTGIRFAMNEMTTGWNADIQAYDDTSNYGGALRFRTATGSATVTPTERMRIDSSGNLLLGTTSVIVSGSRLSISGSSAAGVGLISMVNTNSNTKSYSFGVDGNGNIVMYTSGGTGVYMLYNGTSWNAQSDERTKTDLKPITDAANKVASLRSFTGRYKKDEEGTSRSFLIAQDVQKVLPEAVSTLPDEIGTLGLSYTDVIPLLVAAIKELKEEFDAYKASHP